jgi:hypothetical protein
MQRDQEPLERAIEFWNEALGQRVLFFSEAETDFKFTVSESTGQKNEGWSETFHEGGLGVGCFNTMRPGDTWPVYAHEIGHCFGFMHAAGISIMNPETDEAKVVTEAMKQIVFDLIFTAG